MKKIELFLNLIIREIERPQTPDAIKNALGEIEKIPPVNKSGADQSENSLNSDIYNFMSFKLSEQVKLSTCDGNISFIKNYDFVMARNLMLFSVLTAFIFFALRAFRSDDAIIFLYGSIAFYIFLIFLAPSKVRKHIAFKEKTLRGYREKLIEFAVIIIKKYGLQSGKFSVSFEKDELFLNLKKIENKYYFITD